jgi:hypothetical protein
MHVLDYTTEQARLNQEHFPVFFMGNSLTTLVQAVQELKGRLMPMENMLNKVHGVSLLGKPDDSILFHGMPRKEYQAVFNVAQFLNMQPSGLTVHNLDEDMKMRRLFKPVAVFDTETDPGNEFIAIAEGIEIPIYIFTYAVEMVQFYFEDPSATLDEFLLDHSLVARKHAQTVAALIADEARLSSHKFDNPEEIFESLIRHQR